MLTHIRIGEVLTSWYDPGNLTCSMRNYYGLGFCHSMSREVQPMLENGSRVTHILSFSMPHNTCFLDTQYMQYSPHAFRYLTTRVIRCLAAGVQDQWS